MSCGPGDGHPTAAAMAGSGMDPNRKTSLKTY